MVSCVSAQLRLGTLEDKAEADTSHSRSIYTVEWAATANRGSISPPMDGAGSLPARHWDRVSRVLSTRLRIRKEGQSLLPPYTFVSIDTNNFTAPSCAVGDEQGFFLDSRIFVKLSLATNVIHCIASTGFLKLACHSLKTFKTISRKKKTTTLKTFLNVVLLGLK